MHLVYFLISTRGIQIRRPICIPLHLRHDLTRDHLRQVLIEGGRTPMSILSPTPGTNAVRFLWRPILCQITCFILERVQPSKPAAFNATCCHSNSHTVFTKLHLNLHNRNFEFALCEISCFVAFLSTFAMTTCLRAVSMG